VAKQRKANTRDKRQRVADAPPYTAQAPAGRMRPKMKEKDYQHELRRLHGKLVAMQSVVT